MHSANCTTGGNCEISVLPGEERRQNGVLEGSGEVKSSNLNRRRFITGSDSDDCARVTHWNSHFPSLNVQYRRRIYFNTRNTGTRQYSYSSLIVESGQEHVAESLGSQIIRSEREFTVRLGVSS